jgi:hypothetical protein
MMAPLCGCLSIADINDRFRKVDRAWELDYQKGEDELRYRVVEAPASLVFYEVRKTLIDLGLPIMAESEEKGTITAQNNGPTPLTKEEWSEVVRIEEPRVNELAGWMFSMSGDPSEYVVTVRATIKGKDFASFVHLEYDLDAPKYKRMGIVGTRRAPPTAVQIASQKFWSALGKKLERLKIAEPRRRKAHEFEI